MKWLVSLGASQIFKPYTPRGGENQILKVKS